MVLIGFREKVISVTIKGGARGRSRTGTAVKPRDFKSLVSTNSTTRAMCNMTEGIVLQKRNQVISRDIIFLLTFTEFRGNKYVQEIRIVD